jgi:hypothetical protein
MRLYYMTVVVGIEVIAGVEEYVPELIKFLI